MNEPLEVRSRQDLAAFVDSLADDLELHPERWENVTLPHYLEALAAYLKDLDGWCATNAPQIDPEAAHWRLFAVALAGATVYE